mmetsp:Transcript_2057/g.2972  ORF Transcript_2057/g.2972 Transcript_2057/m.2972 type:complete len:1094 (-) Transcript_2057:32-3313(-)
MTTSVATAMQNKVNALQGEAHFFEDSLSPAKVKEYLARTKESDKLKGMKWLLAMVSKGKDMSELFSDVVKNVVVKSVEVKKMVYIFLVHYADASPTCRELALLSINSFQKDLAASNQLIRALALRVMTSIRVPDIIQIQLLAVRKCASDNSPYVRKCAATAIPKIYALDKEQGPELHRIIEKLLKDGSTMVLGSAVAAFAEVCPKMYALIHPVFRKLCHLLADIDEWGQIILLNVLAFYVRNHFTDPNRMKAKLSSDRNSVPISTPTVQTNQVKRTKRRVLKKAFYSDEEDESVSEDEEIPPTVTPAVPFKSSTFNGIGQSEGGIMASEQDIGSANLDEDHRLVLRVSLPLLKSRNCGVVLAVCAFHFNCGTITDAVEQQLAKALVRILKSKRELQFSVLGAIRSMSAQRPKMFEPYLKDFFVKGTDPLFVSSIKLDILCNIATSSKWDMATPPSWSVVLSEFQSYTRHGNKKFASRSIRSATQIAAVHADALAPTIHALATIMLSSSDNYVIEASIEGLCHLLRRREQCDGREVVIIAQKLANSLNGKKSGFESERAKACAVYLIGEFFEEVGVDVVPDLVRMLAKNFTALEKEVKLQTISLVFKLSLEMTESEAIQSLAAHVLQLARFDLSPDIRDQSRLLASLLGLAAGDASDPKSLVALRERAPFIIQRVKPFARIDTMQGTSLLAGSISSAVGYKVNGYEDLPPWSQVKTDGALRNPPPSNNNSESPVGKKIESGSNDETSESSYSGSESTSGTSESEYDSSSDGSSSEDSSSLSEENESSESGSDNSSELNGEPNIETGEGIGLLNLNESITVPGHTYGMLQETNPPLSLPATFLPVPLNNIPMNIPGNVASFTPKPTLPEGSYKESLLRKQTTGGLEAEYVYLRSLPSVNVSTILRIVLYFSNESDSNFRHIRAVPPRDGTPFVGWGEIQILGPKEKAKVELGIDFGGRVKTVRFEVRTDRGSHMVSITPPQGELICPTMLSPSEYLCVAKELGGLNEITNEFVLKELSLQYVHDGIVRAVNVGFVDGSLGQCTFAGVSLGGGQKERVLVELRWDSQSGKATLRVESDSASLPMLLGPVILKSFQN